MVVLYVWFLLEIIVLIYYFLQHFYELHYFLRLFWILRWESNRKYWKSIMYIRLFAL